MTSASQAKVPVSTSGQTGRVVTMVSPSAASGPSQKLQGNGVAANSSVVPTAVVSAAHIQTSPQTKVLMHMTGQMTVNQARNAVRTGKKTLVLDTECSPSVNLTDTSGQRQILWIDFLTEPEHF